MKKQKKRFALRVESQSPIVISVMYVGQKSAGEGIVLDLSRVGCRILGSEPVAAGEAMRVEITPPTSEKPLVLQATVKWVKELEFGLAFKGLHELETHQLERLLEALLGKENHSGRSPGSLKVNSPGS